ncbi:hypothetical protein DPMN_169005 [Dreissena polymorpha]|uniref:Uncharacterized protein n=1 Tax=Dreissena polymorpha TaxID=45954 RepID=A0A9D4F4G3_DREPO|nr:hypothetical protein DPMN_169005 [Dreissena polymorpha]
MTRLLDSIVSLAGMVPQPQFESSAQEAPTAEQPGTRRGVAWAKHRGYRGREL